MVDGPNWRTGHLPSRRFTVGVAGIFMAGVIVANWRGLSTSLTEDGDLGADAIRARRVWTETSGVYSRWDFHHPGPFPLWVKALGVRIGGIIPGVGPLGGQMLVQLAVVTVAVGMLGFVLAAATRRRAVIPAAFLLAAVGGQGSQVSMWAPNMATWLIVLGVAGLAAMTGGFRWGFPVAVAAGLAAAHCHLLFVAPGVMIVGAAVALRFRYAGDVRATGVAASALIAPLAVAVVLGESPWLRYLEGRENGGATRSWPTGLRVLAGTISPIDLPRPQAGLLVLVLMLVAAVNVWFWRDWSPVGVVVVAGAAWLAYLVAICRLDFLIDSVGGSTVLLLLLLPAASRLDVSDSAVLAVAATIGVVAVLSPGGRGRTPAGIAEQVIAAHDVGTLVVDHVEDPWNSYRPATATVLLAQRKGIPVCVLERRWPYWVPADLICDGDPGPVEVVTFTSDRTWSTARA